MQKGKHRIPEGVWSCLQDTLIILLLLSIFPVGLFVWAWGTDLKHEWVAREMIDPQAVEYIEQNYPDNDFEVNEASHVFKENCFRVRVRSRSSQDTYFVLDYDDDEPYELIRDSYDSAVLEGCNTRARVVEEYVSMVEECLGKMNGLSRLYSDFCHYSDSESRGLYFSPQGLKLETLVVDYPYDAAAMGNDYGYLEVTFLDSDENINIHRALERMLEIDRVLTENGIGYYVIEVTIANGEYPNNTHELNIYGVRKQDLFCDDPIDRLQEMWDEQESHRQALKEQWAQAGE